MKVNLLEKMDGMMGLVAPEKMPPYFFQKLINWRLGDALHRLRKRSPFTSILTGAGDSNMINCKGLADLKDIGGNRLLVGYFGSTKGIRESVYSGGSYGSTSQLSGGAQDKRLNTGFDDTGFRHPLNIHNELRLAGGATSGFPAWLGYIKDRKRFYNPDSDSYGVSFTNQRYLDDAIYDNISSSQWRTVVDSDSIVATAELVSYDANAVMTDTYYSIYASPVIDGYQRGIPRRIYTTDIPTTVLVTGNGEGNTTKIVFTVDSGDTQLAPRLTAIDLFLIASTEPLIEEEFKDTDVAYFLERIYLGAEPDKPFFTTQGDVDNTGGSEKVTIPEGKVSFAGLKFWIYNKDTDEWYFHDGTATESGTDLELDLDTTIGATPASSTTGDELEFYTGWYPSGSNYKYETFYDNDNFKTLKANMWAFTGIPRGDTGITDVKHEASAWNGNRRVITKMATEKAMLSYYSTADNPDIFPNQNIIRHRQSTVGVANVSQDFLFFCEKHIERVMILENTQHLQDDHWSDRGMAGPLALAQISDDMVAVFDQKGPYLVAGRELIPIGDTLHEWWRNTLTYDQKTECRVLYNQYYDEIWFIFPTYTTSPYTTGVIFVFDVNAYKRGMASPWWTASLSNFTVKNGCVNFQHHLIVANDYSGTTLNGEISRIADLSTEGSDESVNTLARLKLLQNPDLAKEVYWNKLILDIRGSGRSSPDDTVTVKCYFDEESSPSLSPTLDTDHFDVKLHKVAETLEIEVVTGASANDVNLRNAQLVFYPKRI